MGARRKDPPQAARGFTLIEIMAVVAIMGLVIGIALPNFGLRSKRVMEGEAKQLAAHLEFARQRSVMTGVPHRMVIDVEAGRYWLEWLVSEARALGRKDLGERPVYFVGGREEIPLAAPRASERSYHALAGSLGRTTRVQKAVRIDGIEIAGGFLEQGRVELVFRPDGTSESAQILLSDDDGHRIGVEVAPFADTVRIGHAAR